MSENEAQRAQLREIAEKFNFGHDAFIDDHENCMKALQAAYAAGAAAARAGEPVTPLTDVQWDTAPATKRKCGHVTAGQCNQCERCFACCTCCPECNSSRKLQKFNDPNKCRHPHHAARQEEK